MGQNSIKTYLKYTIHYIIKYLLTKSQVFNMGKSQTTTLSY